jgi:predicted amidohydrolase
MKIYVCQLDIAWEDKAANFAKVRQLLGSAKLEKGSLVLLPEMFATGFSMNVQAIAEDPDAGPTARFLAECATQFGVFVAGGLVTIGADGKGRNEMIVAAPDGARAARYAKIHPFTYGEESHHYSGGDKVCTFSCRGAAVAPFICYDLRFPEIFRVAMRNGAEVYIVIASWPDRRAEHWTTLLRARAIENQAYVAGVNRCGRDPRCGYSGHSQIIDPQGNVLVDAGEGENVVGAEIDLHALHSYRAKFPALNDLRPEFLAQIKYPHTA